MEHLIRAVRDAVKKKSWYAATALALVLPDACGAVDQPGRGQSRDRYIRWADRWTRGYFSNPMGKVFLSGRELFALRCAFLHEGDLMTNPDRPQAPDDSDAMFEVLNQVTLYGADMPVVPARTMAKSGSDRTTGYGIGVAEFCEAICAAVESWLGHARADSTLAARIERLTQTGAIIQVLPNFGMRPL
jgi:hypothetical protein